jgi:cobalamin biosynthesis protein CobT
MGGTGKSIGAMKAAVSLSEVLAILNIPFEVTGFTTDARRIHATRAELDVYNRVEGLVHFVFKAFEENFNTVKYRLLAIRSNNNNCDGESVMWAAQRLFRRKEKRKILFVFSDGMPACYSQNQQVLETDLKETVKKVENMGAEVYGIGIYTDAPSHFYRENSEIQMYGEQTIASAIFTCLKKKLTQGADSRE